MEAEQSGVVLWIVFGLIALTLGVAIFAAVKLRRERRSVARCHDWPEVTGRIIRTGVREVPMPDVGMQYVPVVVYRYVAGDVQYESERLTMGGHQQYSMRRSAERRLARYMVGNPVQVRVDPANPAESVLECRSPHIPVLWAMLGLIAVVMIVGMGMLLLTPGVAGPEPIVKLPGSIEEWLR
jgi:hypothetical protein